MRVAIFLLCLWLGGCGVVAAPCRIGSGALKAVPLVGHVAAFDVDEAKIGTEIGGKMVFPLSKLPDMIGRMSIKIGVIATPPAQAQEVADMMVKAGIRAIWNFSHTKLNVPPNTIVQHENLASSLVVLSKKLAMALQANT